MARGLEGVCGELGEGDLNIFFSGPKFPPSLKVVTKYKAGSEKFTFSGRSLGFGSSSCTLSLLGVLVQEPESELLKGAVTVSWTKHLSHLRSGSG